MAEVEMKAQSTSLFNQYSFLGVFMPSTAAVLAAPTLTVPTLSKLLPTDPYYIQALTSHSSIAALPYHQ